MAQEIERKFLVAGDYKSAAVSSSHIVQGYICSTGGRTVRVRLRDERAYLTIKGASDDGGLSRFEWETEIPSGDARELLHLAVGALIDKHRYLVPVGRHIFEVDEFHGDNEGLVMPPKVAPVQVCIVPIQQKKEAVLEKAYELRGRLKGNFRVKVDDTDKTPGYKFAEAEMRGYPIRVEIGPKDIEAGKCVLCRRDTREKLEVALDELEEKAGELLDTIQREMLERARVHRDTHTYEARDFEEFQRIFAEKAGFVKAMWCGDQACEDLIKEKMSVTSRCMPFEQEHLSDTCVCCGKTAKKMVYWGKAY